jgi:hypothetical protein
MGSFLKPYDALFRSAHMVKLLDISAFSAQENLPLDYVMGLCEELLREGVADRLIDSRTIVKFDNSDFEAVRSALSSDGRLADLSARLRMNTSLAKELVLRFGELNPSVPRQSIERLLSSTAARVSLVVEVKATKEIIAGEEFDVGIKVIADKELREARLLAEVSSGLVILESPSSTIGLIPQSEDGYTDLVKLRSVSPGEQRITLKLRAKQGEVVIEKSQDALIVVHSQPPDLEIKLTQTVANVSLGKEYSILAQIRNTGKGSAKGIRISGFESLISSIRMIQGIPEGLEVPPQANIEIPLVILPLKSGLVSASNLTLEYSDVEGKRYSKSIGSLQIEVITPQPKIGLSVNYPKAISRGAETRVEYTLSNSGEGDARNVRLRIFPSPTVALVRGALSRTIPILKSQQFEVGEFDVRIPESNTVLIDHAEIEYVDLENNAKTILLSTRDLGAEEGVQVSVLQDNISLSKAEEIQTGERVTKEEMETSKPALEILPLLESTSVETWTELLEGGKYSKINFGNMSDVQVNYSQQGYRNLLIAIFESKKLGMKQVSQLVGDDKFTFRAAEIIVGLRERGEVEYSIASSDVQNADEVLKILGVPIEEGEKPELRGEKSSKRAQLRKQPSFKPKDYRFQDSRGNYTVVRRELILGEESGRPEAVRYSLLKEN